MSSPKKKFTDAAELTPLKIQEHIATNLFADGAYKDWLDKTLAYIELNEDKFKPQGALEATLTHLLAKAVYNNADNAVEAAITKYPDKIAKSYVGLLFWVAAGNTNIKTMQLITETLGEENISSADIAEAFAAAVLGDSPEVIDYLAKNHADKITAETIRSSFIFTSTYAATNTMAKFIKLWSDVIQPTDIDEALRCSRQNKIIYEGSKENFDYKTAISYLEQTKATLFQSPQIKNQKLEP
jgi:hypothetical protein